MQKARYLVALSCACASAACGTEVAMAVDPASVDAGPPGIPDKPPVCMSPTILGRILRGKVQLTEAVRYKRPGYYFGFPQDERIAYSTSSNNTTLVAWLNTAGTQIRVTPVTPPELNRVAEFNRAGDDVMIDGTELGGLVALDDGFAVLTRRPDPGELIAEGTGQATFLVRWQNGRQRFAVPLTGTRSITIAPDDEKRDFPPEGTPLALSGRLVFNGLHYGAYFGVSGGANDRYYNISSDKLVQVDDAGLFVSGWRAACRQNLGGRLVSDDAGGFVPFCMSDGLVGAAGVHAALGARTTNRLATEVEFSSGGYSGGNLGSAVKTGDGYIVAWASRGINTGTGAAAHYSHEPAIALVTKDRALANVAGNPRWPFLVRVSAEPPQDAVNVHAASYGDKVLLVWETIESPQFRSATGSSTGLYGGTHFRLIDANGIPVSEEEVTTDAIAPNGADDIVEFPNGDLGWAYVPEERNFQMPGGPSVVPNATEIRLVKLPLCLPP